MIRMFFVLATAVPVNFASAALIYTPTNFGKDAKIVVVIHGCLQSAESMALGTGWNQIADRNNLVIVYPQVPAGHPVSCWSWYLPENQKSGSGQLEIIMDEIRRTKRIFKLNNPEVYVAGISSGGITAAGLLACYPNEFKGGAVHSAASYGLAQNLADGEKVLKQGPPTPAPVSPCQPRDFKGSLIVLHGSADPVVNPLHAPRVITDFSGANSHLVPVNGLGHAWSGFTENLRHKELLGPKGAFPTILPFFSEAGPNATQMIWDYFSATRMPNNTKKKKKN